MSHKAYIAVTSGTYQHVFSPKHSKWLISICYDLNMKLLLGENQQPQHVKLSIMYSPKTFKHLEVLLQTCRGLHPVLPVSCTGYYHEVESKTNRRGQPTEMDCKQFLLAHPELMKEEITAADLRENNISLQKDILRMCTQLEELRLLHGLCKSLHLYGLAWLIRQQYAQAASADSYVIFQIVPKKQQPNDPDCMAVDSTISTKD